MGGLGHLKRPVFAGPRPTIEYYANSTFLDGLKPVYHMSGF